MSGPLRISGEAFAVERLRENPDLDYGTLRREAEAAGVSIQPIQYGRARKQLGLPPLSTRSEPRLGSSTPTPSPFDREPRPAASSEPEPVDEADDDTDASADDDVAEPAAPEATNDIVAPRRRGSPAFDWLIAELRREPAALFADLKQRATAVGFSIAPIMYGRAKAVLGLVPVRPRGQGGKRVRRAAGNAAAPVPEAPRVLKQVESVAADRFAKQLEDVRNLEQLVAVVKQLDSDRRRLRDLLERIVTMIDEALG
ncbi:MAG: hypothetical protein JNK15_21955 [Planctomycetes bacterium]|nr:hypothetical protein [Planctomycetota bacterium]